MDILRLVVLGLLIAWAVVLALAFFIITLVIIIDLVSRIRIIGKDE